VGGPRRARARRAPGPRRARRRVTPRASVVMPSFGQAALVPRAVACLVAQTERDWELVVVDDGSPDDVAAALAPHGADPRIRLHRLPANRGLGAAANAALGLARAPVVAYLPSDDLWAPGHLAALLDLLDARPDAVLASAGDPHRLCAIAHRAAGARWVEREDLESDLLELLLLAALRPHGAFADTSDPGTATATVHPAQRTAALLGSRDGGLNAFRARYGIRTPLRLRTSEGERVDEEALYAPFRDRPAPEPGALRVLVVGELAYNPERIVALERHGCALAGLWIDDPLGFMTVGPLPFGGIPDRTWADWPDWRPDVIYAGLNWRAIPLAHAVLDRARALGIPVAWHLKEAPHRAVERGDWTALADLWTRADARILASGLERDLLEAWLPGRADPAATHVLDGDLPAAHWLRTGRRATSRRSDADGEVHTVLCGRPYGMDPGWVAALAAAGGHLHVHGGPLPDALRRAGGDRIHEHPPVERPDWVAVLSAYDAGWLHPHRSANGGEPAVATWDDCNLPARLPTYVAAGLPLLADRNAGHRTAVGELIEATGAGVVHDGPADAVARLLAGEAAGPAARAWTVREELTFDAHAGWLADLLRALAAGPAAPRGRGARPDDRRRNV